MTTSARPLSSFEKLRLAGGALLQPFLTAAVAFVLFPLFLLDGQGQALAGGYPSDVTGAAVSVAVSAGLVAVVITLSGALPLAVWLMKRRQLGFGETLLFGLGFGLLPYALLGLAAGGTHGVMGLARGLAFSSALGLSGAAGFWLVVLRRSDREPAHG